MTGKITEADQEKGEEMEDNKKGKEVLSTESHMNSKNGRRKGMREIALLLKDQESLKLDDTHNTCASGSKSRRVVPSSSSSAAGGKEKIKDGKKQSSEVVGERKFIEEIVSEEEDEYDEDDKRDEDYDPGRRTRRGNKRAR
ncbi:uncharacterized protein LOC127259443 [Andrographis paniculata]|uniref:uncharacterized protein LOC127259443 n=1 Tax=Andrographis paniculata TaxID=175694 RepID=UPI0021E78867|nr:uncharacterized protein LOC127259443 [Andrographis paniculata]